MNQQDKNNQNYVQADRGVFPSFRGVAVGRGVFHSHRGVPERRGVLKWRELPFNPKLRQRARELRKAGNLSEVLFWNQVKNKKFLNLDFDRQKIIGNYIVDFYCKDLGAVIEIDGGSHDQKQEYDQERDAYLESFGLKIFHIQDVDIKKNLGGVLRFLRENITPRHCLAMPPLYERGITPRPAMRGENTHPSGTPLREGN